MEQIPQIPGENENNHGKHKKKSQPLDVAGKPISPEEEKPTVVWENPELVKTRAMEIGYEKSLEGLRQSSRPGPEKTITALSQAVREGLHENLPTDEGPVIEYQEITSDQSITGFREYDDRPPASLSPEQAELIKKGRTADSLIFPDLANEEVPVYEEITLESFLQKNRLEGNDAFLLYEFFKDDLDNVEIWAFIEKVAPKPADALLLKNNLEYLSPQFIHSLLVTGSSREHFMDERGYRNSIFTIKGAQLSKGGLGMVSNVLYAFEDDLQLRPALAKTALDSPDAQGALQDEVEMARKIKHLLDRNSEDPRTKRILKPIFVGQNFLIMPEIRNPRGEILGLDRLANWPEHSVQYWAYMMHGAMEGNNFLAEHGIVNNDFKPGNILDGPEGGVLIDWGGFFDKKVIAEGKGEILGSTEHGSMYPLVQNALLPLLTEEEWEKNRGNIPNTPKYMSVHLMSMELADQMPAGATHKFSLYRIIESYLIQRHPELDPTKKLGSKFAKLKEMDKLYTDPLQLGEVQLDEAELLLYELYLKLQKAHFHPYRFKEDNIKNGIDPEYISNGEIIARLEEIYSLPQS